MKKSTQKSHQLHKLQINANKFRKIKRKKNEKNKQFPN